MKMFWKTDDRAIDKLLGAQRARQGDPAQICREFDPDLANAYIEHSLTTIETGRYEQHLSACTHCRKSVVTLSRMAVTDPVFSQTEVKSFALAGETRTGIKRWFGVMSAPQWAMAATAVLVLAISLPFLMSNKRESAKLQATPSQSDSAVASNKPQSESDSLEAHASGNAAANTATQPAQQPGSNVQAKIEREQESPDKNLLAIAKEPVAESPATGAGTETTAPAPQPAPPIETKADSTPADQTVAKAEQTPPASRREEPQLPKIDPEAAKSLAKEKDSAQVSQLTTGVPGGEDINKKEATIREDSSSIPPPPKPSSSDARDRSRAMTRGTPGSAKFRDSNSEAARSASSVAKVGGRKFLLRNDIWTDKDYNPNKEMPMVTIFRDSDVYRELFSKHSGMRPFLTGFAETARVIFIYKGTVYKLIPQ
jgi:hypothetical protein